MGSLAARRDQCVFLYTCVMGIGAARMRVVIIAFLCLPWKAIMGKFTCCRDSIA